MGGILVSECADGSVGAFGSFSQFAFQSDASRGREIEMAVLPLWEYLRVLFVAESVPNSPKPVKEAKKALKQTAESDAESEEPVIDQNFNDSSFLSHVPSLECEFKELSLSDAQHFGVSANHAKKLEEKCESTLQTLCVTRAQCGGAAHKAGMQHGDILYSIDGEVVVSFPQVEEKLHDEVFLK
jgi:predicted metalloprotease with PDZ domain